MPFSSRSDVSQASLEEDILRLSALPAVKAAFDWFRDHDSEFCDWQMDLASIPAPLLGEAERAEWMLDRFRNFGLEEVHIDAEGNALGLLPGAAKQCVSLSAHIDTVFPAETPLLFRKEETRIYGPGVSDNGAGVTALLAMAGALQASDIVLNSPILFIGNVGEEGEGDLRGMRHIFSESSYRDSIGYSLILDGAGCDTIVSEALGSRRFEVTVTGPGGHSWSDFGTPNPIAVLARAIHAFTQVSVPSSPKTTFNVGVIRGGMSVNSIPESASMRVDIRSSSRNEMDRLEAALRESIAMAVEHELRIMEKRGQPIKTSHGLNFEVVGIGDRPAGELKPASKMLQVIRAVDSYLGNTATIQRASTDANIPLSMGREALAIGGGGSGGRAHTLQEWFDCDGRELGLQRIFLTLLALTGVQT